MMDVKTTVDYIYIADKTTADPVTRKLSIPTSGHIVTMYDHRADIKMVAGILVSYCVKCGKILDQSPQEMIMTCSVTK